MLFLQEKDSSEQAEVDIDKYISSRSAEADRLLKALDNELLGPDEKQQITARLLDITDELKRADRVKKKRERRNY